MRFRIRCRPPCRLIIIDSMKQILVTLFLVAASGVLPLSASAQPAYREIQVSNGGSIRGTVRFSGNPLTVKELPVNRDVESCGNKKLLPNLILGKNMGVKNAIVSLEGIRSGKSWKKEPVVVLDQQKCEYVPHVVIAPLGAQLEIVNSDDVLHNVHSYELNGELKTLFNVAQPIKGLRTKLALDKPGTLVATCDAGHPWMSAYIRIADHPYMAITDAEGNFVIDNIPGGTYRLTMWHEPFTVTGETKMEEMQKHYFEPPITITKDVTVAAGGTATITFEVK